MAYDELAEPAAAQLSEQSKRSIYSTARSWTCGLTTSRNERRPVVSKGFGESLKMLGDLRAKMEKMKEEAGAIRVEGVAGGGMVKVAMNGRLEVLSVEIEP